MDLAETEEFKKAKARAEELALYDLFLYWESAAKRCDRLQEKRIDGTISAEESRTIAAQWHAINNVWYDRLMKADRREKRTKAKR